MLLYYFFEHPLKDDETPLDDFLHRVSPILSVEYHHFITLASLAVIVTLIAASPITTSSFVKVWLFRLGVFYIIRTLMISLTTLPCPTPTNISDEASAFQKLLRLGGVRDNIPSGHAGGVFVSLFAAIQYEIIGKGVGIPIFILQILSPILTRQHYTIDPIISFFIALVLTQNVYSPCPFIS
jgi:hypothetical protein